MAPSRAIPAPLMPPPMTRRSNVSLPSRASAAVRGVTRGFYRAPDPMSRRVRGGSLLEERNQPLGHLRGGRPAAEVAGPGPALRQEPVRRALETARGTRLTDVPQEHDARE